VIRAGSMNESDAYVTAILLIITCLPWIFIFAIIYSTLIMYVVQVNGLSLPDVDANVLFFVIQAFNFLLIFLVTSKKKISTI
jgi:hypothetical protein